MSLGGGSWSRPPLHSQTITQTLQIYIQKPSAAPSQNGRRLFWGVVMSLEDYDFRFTPVKGKAAYQKNWPNNPMKLELVKPKVAKGEATGYGIMLGPVSGGIAAIDFDGEQAFEYFAEIFSSGIWSEDFNFVWTSGRPMRAQIGVSVPPQHWDVVRSVKVGPGGKLELRWGGCQSVLPPSQHPETGHYRWLVEPDGSPIRQMPEQIMDFWLEQCKPPAVDEAQDEPFPEVAPDVLFQKVCKLVEVIRDHAPTLTYPEWLIVSYGVANAVGKSEAIAIMKKFYPEYRRGEYNKLLGSSYNCGKSPTIASLCAMARNFDPDRFRQIVAETNAAGKSPDDLLRQKLQWRQRQCAKTYNNTNNF